VAGLDVGTAKTLEVIAGLAHRDTDAFGKMQLPRAVRESLHAVHRERAAAAEPGGERK
jgi:hypothetical protein